MTKEKVYKAILIFIVFLFAASAIGYLLFPSAMLSVVGITSNNQMNFLVRTLAAALVALIPSAWSVRAHRNGSLSESVIFGLVANLIRWRTPLADATTIKRSTASESKSSCDLCSTVCAQLMGVCTFSGRFLDTKLFLLLVPPLWIGMMVICSIPSGLRMLSCHCLPLYDHWILFDCSLVR
jgi:hypothetical protein